MPEDDRLMSWIFAIVMLLIFVAIFAFYATA